MTIPNFVTIHDLLLRQGWQWVLPFEGHRIIERIKPPHPKYTKAEFARVCALEAELKQLHYDATARAFSKDDRARSGCLVELSEDGSRLLVTAGIRYVERIRGQHRKRAGKIRAKRRR